MTMIEDYRKKNDPDDEEENEEETPNDEVALEMKDKNPLAEEESVEEDDSAGD